MQEITPFLLQESTQDELVEALSAAGGIYAFTLSALPAKVRPDDLAGVRLWG